MMAAAELLSIIAGSRGKASISVVWTSLFATLVSIVIPTIPPGHEQERLAR